MQCASCRFENMPGVGACGRCGSPLGLQTLAVDVHPPRAGTRAKRWRRRWQPFRSWYFRAREAGRTRWLEEMEGTELLGMPLGILIRLFIPGWAHLHRGRRTSGLLFLGIWLVLLACAFLFFRLAQSEGVPFSRGGVPLGVFARMREGLSLGGICLGLAFSVHLSSCLSLARGEGMETGEFWRNIGLWLIMALAVFYLSISGLLVHLAGLI